MSRIIIVLGFLLVSFCSIGQISTPEKRKFNVGIAAGLNIWKYRPMIALDMSYKGTTLRAMPNYRYYSIGLTQELTKISVTYYNLYWTVSLYGGYGYDYDAYTDPVAIAAKDNEYKKITTTGIFTTGLKTYFLKRMYTNVMAGVMYNKNTGGKGFGVNDSSELLPYFEITLGHQIFKTYPKPKPEELE